MDDPAEWRDLLLEKLIKNRCCRRVRERVIHLNPRPVRGAPLRGTGRRVNPAAWEVSRGKFIRQYGRALWDRIPNGAKRKNGKREWVETVFIQDNMHTIYDGHVPSPQSVLPWYLTRRHANHPKGCPMESPVISGFGA